MGGRHRRPAAATAARRRAGEEVVQVYARDPLASVTRPWRQLVAFACVELAGGESCGVAFDLHPGCTALHDRALRLVIEPGEVELHVGGSSTATRLCGRFRITGRACAAHPLPEQPRVQVRRARGRRRS